LPGLFTLESSTHEELFDIFESMDEAHDKARICISRLPLRSLLRFISMDDTNVFWLTEQESKTSIAPSLDDILALIEEQSVGRRCLILLEGIDWLLAKNGQQHLMKFLQHISRVVLEGSHTMLLSVDALTFDPVLWARIRALAPAMERERTVSHHSKTEVVEPSSESYDPPHITHLTKLSRVGFHNALLTKRMLQWRRMGFDVSELEPALAMQDMDRAHAIYHAVEEKIQRAIDLCRLLETKSGVLGVTMTETSQFRLMQLTGLEEVERILDGIQD